jgi:hypothetical protein
MLRLMRLLLEPRVQLYTLHLLENSSLCVRHQSARKVFRISTLPVLT